MSPRYRERVRTRYKIAYKKGVIYISNNIKLLCGDSNLLIKNIPNKSIDLIIIDPPYLLNMTGGKKGTSPLAKSLLSLEKELTDADLIDNYDLSILNEFIRVQDKINIYIWCNLAQIRQYLDFFIGKYNCSYEVIIWNKTNAMPLFNNKYLNDKEYCLYFRKRGYCNPSNYKLAKTVYYLPLTQKEKRLYNHPTIKPLEIIEAMVLNSSRKNETILDCFMGSGTTGVAVIKAGEDRKFIGIEKSKNYFLTAKKRIEDTIKDKEDKL